MNWLQLVSGVMLVGWGRSLFWLFVATLGFLLGFQVSVDVFGLSHLFALAVAAGMGLAGALLALLLKDFAIGIAGFLAGGWVAWVLAVGLAPELSLIIGLVGGVIGWIMMYAIFDTALVLLTSLVGAHMIVQQFHLTQPNETLVLVVLTVVGFLMQTRRREPQESKTRVVHHHHYHGQA